MMGKNGRGRAEEDCQFFGSLCYRMFGMNTSENFCTPRKISTHIPMDSLDEDD